MNEVLQAIAALIRLITQHLATVFEVGSGALFIALVSTMPKLIPKTLQDWWTWVRDSLQTAIPATRNHREQDENPTTPAPPEK